jgi:hypothetical protein
VACATALSAVLTSRGVAVFEWFEAAGRVGLHLPRRLPYGSSARVDGLEERRRAAVGWMACAGLALGGILVLAMMREDVHRR